MTAEVEKKQLVAISSEDEYGTLLKRADKKLSVVHFFASWAPQCQQVDDILIELSKESNVSDVISIIKVEAESFPAISSKYNITAVPTCILIKSAREVDRVNGVNAAELTKKVRQHAGAAAISGTSSSSPVKETSSLNERLKKLVNSAPMMVFMKGSPDQPRCGFSRTLVQILGEQGASYSTFDILSDEDVRQGLKEYSNWPTYPQIYIKGELVGGLDIVKELIASGEFQSMLPQAAKQSSLDERLKELINKEPVMLFMKGSPSNAKCGFSKTIVGILNSKSIKYGHFDILEDEEVRQGLKTFSNWPTYPQLYVKGELVGGVDIVKEMSESGELEKLATDLKA